jgi:DNA-directed RNA polymerase subunit RPC12/RpoP
MGMILNKKYKCPVCTNRIPFQLNFTWEKYINCNHCNSILDYTENSKGYSWIPFFFINLTTFLFESQPFRFIIHALAFMSVVDYLAFFGKLETVVRKEPQYTINDDLDNIRNSGSNK